MTQLRPNDEGRRIAEAVRPEFFSVIASAERLFHISILSIILIKRLLLPPLPPGRVQNPGL